MTTQVEPKQPFGMNHEVEHESGYLTITPIVSPLFHLSPDINDASGLIEERRRVRLATGIKETVYEDTHFRHQNVFGVFVGGWISVAAGLAWRQHAHAALLGPEGRGLQKSLNRDLFFRGKVNVLQPLAGQCKFWKSPTGRRRCLWVPNNKSIRTRPWCVSPMPPGFSGCPDRAANRTDGLKGRGTRRQEWNRTAPKEKRVKNFHLITEAWIPIRTGPCEHAGSGAVDGEWGRS